MMNYEDRIRAYSTPEKIFRYFATLKYVGMNTLCECHSTCTIHVHLPLASPHINVLMSMVVCKRKWRPVFLIALSLYMYYVCIEFTVSYMCGGYFKCLFCYG